MLKLHWLNKTRKRGKASDEFLNGETKESKRERERRRERAETARNALNNIPIRSRRGGNEFHISHSSCTETAPTVPASPSTFPYFYIDPRRERKRRERRWTSLLREILYLILWYVTNNVMKGNQMFLKDRVHTNANPLWLFPCKCLLFCVIMYYQWSNKSTKYTQAQLNWTIKGLQRFPW